MPTGSTGKPVYYGSEGSIEIFLRTTGREAGGIRGAFVSQCPVGKDEADPRGHPLFDLPAFAKRSRKDRFRHQVVDEGRTREGVNFKETISLAGRIQGDAVLGAYSRVRTTKGGGQAAERCVTGPIQFRAVRYLPALG